MAGGQKGESDDNRNYMAHCASGSFYDAKNFAKAICNLYGVCPSGVRYFYNRHIICLRLTDSIFKFSDASSKFEPLI